MSGRQPYILPTRQSQVATITVTDSQDKIAPAVARIGRDDDGDIAHISRSYVTRRLLVLVSIQVIDAYSQKRRSIALEQRTRMPCEQPP